MFGHDMWAILQGSSLLVLRDAAVEPIGMHEVAHRHSQRPSISRLQEFALPSNEDNCTAFLSVLHLPLRRHVHNPCPDACVGCYSSRSCGQNSKCGRRPTEPSHRSIEGSQDTWSSDMYSQECSCPKRLGLDVKQRAQSIHDRRTMYA